MKDVYFRMHNTEYEIVKVEVEYQNRYASVDALLVWCRCLDKLWSNISTSNNNDPNGFIITSVKDNVRILNKAKQLITREEIIKAILLGHKVILQMRDRRMI